MTMRRPSLPRDAPSPSRHLIVLCIGGVDSSSAAGLDVDVPAVTAAGATPRVVVTANTVQNDQGVRSVGAVAPSRWLDEARAEVVGAKALKFGLLPGVDQVRAADQLLEQIEPLPWVLDPVLSSSSGYEFLDPLARAVLLDRLLPRAPVITPNLDEAALLTDRRVESMLTLEGRIEAARELLRRGAEAVVIKGGHGNESPLLDLLVGRDREPLWIEHRRVPGELRGTGCRFASALAARLAQGDTLEAGVRYSGAYVGGLLACMGRS